MLVARVVSLLVSFFTAIYVIRYLGPHNYGLLSYALSFVSLFGFLSSFGIDQVVYRELVKRPEDEAKILGSGFIIRFGMGFFTTILTILGAYLIGANQIELILISVISLTLVGGAWQISIYAFQARVESRYPAWITLGIGIILAAVKLTLVYFDQGIIYFALVLVLESILYAVCFVFMYQWRYGGILRWRPDTSTILFLLKAGFPLMLSIGSMALYARIDQVMLIHYLDATAVGIYDAAVRLSDVWYIIPTVLVGSLFPAIVNARSVAAHLFVKRIRMLALFLVLLNILIIVPTLIAAPFIVQLLYGEAFAATADVLGLYIWSLIGYGLGQLMYAYLLAEHYLYIYLATTLGTMALNVLLNLWLIAAYGLAGAALATLIAYSCIPLIPFLFKKIRVQLLTPSKANHTL